MYSEFTCNIIQSPFVRSLLLVHVKALPWRLLTRRILFWVSRV